MKRIFMGLCLALFALGAMGAEAKLEWVASTSSTAIGYKMHAGTASRSYSIHVDTGAALTGIIPNLAAGQKYYFAVTAYNATGAESDYSNEVPYVVAGGVVTPPATVPIPAGIKPYGSLQIVATVGAVDTASISIDGSVAIPCAIASGIASCPYQSRFFDTAGTRVVTISSSKAGATASASASFAVGTMGCSTSASIKNGADIYVAGCKRTWTRK